MTSKLTYRIFILFFFTTLLTTGQAHAKKNNPRKELSMAIEAGDYKKFKRLVKSGKFDLDEPYHSSSPLIETCEKARVDMIKYLIKKGAIIEGLSKKTPLTEFIKSGCSILSPETLLSTIDVFLIAGANINYPGEEGYTPFMFACLESKSEKVLQGLIDRGADINYQQGNDQKAPIFMAIESSNFIALDLLIKNDVSPSVLFDGISPLNFACFEGNLKAVETLVEK
ncbi:MAG: hypothetical protein K940chlam6_01695 [Chlamydiae bacterium]|nr:hypothetical protein [Chlamydiota bacterium]